MSESRKEAATIQCQRGGTIVELRLNFGTLKNGMEGVLSRCIFFFSQYFSQQVTVPTCSPCPLEVVLGMKKDLHSYPGLDGKDKINSHALNGRKVQKKRERKCTLNYSL